MSTMCQADGLSRNEIRLIAKRLRKIFNIKGYCFPIVKFLDVVLPTIDEEFSLSIVEPDEITPGHYAITYPDTHEMVVRSDVYEKAINGDGRSRFTLAHELFHYLFHTANHIRFARANEEIPFYIKPEWQANTFAAELLVPMDLVKNMSANDIVKNCKVSWQCAKIQVENFKK